LLKHLTLILLLLSGPSRFVRAETLQTGSFELQAELLYHEDFSESAKGWKTEGRGKMWVEGGRLFMDASEVEMTAWCPQKLNGNLLITYRAYVLAPEDANNINLIFMAIGTAEEDVLNLQLSGAYKEYHQLSNYIMTFTSGYTRLRRNPGFNLVSENTAVKALTGNEYEVAIILSEKQIRCFINDIPVHSFTDEARHQKGRAALRTWHTRLWWDDFKVYRILESLDR